MTSLDLPKFIEIRFGSDTFKEEVSLRDRVLRKPLNLQFSLEDISHEKDHLHYGVQIRETLVACVVLTPVSKDKIKLRQMAVSPEHQSKRLGAQLVHHVEQLAIANGYRVIELHAREVAVGFYEKLGYKTEGVWFEEVSLPHLKMTKHLGI